MAMMEFEQAEAFMRRFTYKPGWVFALIPNYGATSWGIHVSFDTEDTFNPGHDIKIGFRRTMPIPPNEDYLAAQLLKIIDGIERHEAREWFKVDGQMPFDPHKEQRA